ncbi:hypothetical protein HPC38_01020 [Pasteurellaceae bacterium HPA106]|uniref:phage protease n=1 Tax=Spirabiliibacterium pneumoniae TaxID=221400 RepID=UPI001AACA9F4|nr:phage protease [Spirabiliibacterium pneumoniae]MBE2895462.1 hypothetical protein [Spirabiliibacterium pneumoniae]
MSLTPVALSFEIVPNGRIQLFPYGRFYPADGRSKEGWYVDDSNGYALAEEINARKVKMMVDYEHQTLWLDKNGQGNIAAGWIEHAEYISGKGLFADVSWTTKASAHIKQKEYRYISPYFLADKSGQVIRVINAALTNRPALHELEEAIAASDLVNQAKGNPMLELLKKLFNLPAASEDALKEKLVALSNQQEKSGVAITDVYGRLEKANADVVALSEKAPDPKEYVALSELQAVQAQLNKLQSEVNADKVKNMIDVALSEGRLLPAQKAWAEKLGAKDATALSEYLQATAPAAFTQSQSEGKNPNEADKVALSEEQRAAAKMLGMTDAEFQAILPTGA